MTLEEYLIKNNFSYADLGRMMQVSANTIRRWATKTAKPHKRNAAKIVKKTKGDVSPQEMEW